jgi:hypothetical protein
VAEHGLEALVGAFGRSVRRRDEPIEASRQSRSDDHDLGGGVDQHPDADRETVGTRGRVSSRYQ